MEKFKRLVLNDQKVNIDNQGSFSSYNVIEISDYNNGSPTLKIEILQLWKWYHTLKNK